MDDFGFQPSGGISPADLARLTKLENNEYKILYFATISATTGTITKPTNSTILLDQFYSGGDAIVETLSNGQPTGQSPLTAGGSVVSVSSFDTSGNYVLSGTPTSFDVALVYIFKIKAVDYSNVTVENILLMGTLETTATIGAIINGANTATPNDTDLVMSVESAVAKKNTWTEIKSFLKTYFDSVTQTLTNKRITLRTLSITSSATPTIDTNSYDCVDITALAAAITSFTTNLSGTATNFQKLIIRIKDNGTARAITWGASFVALGAALPTTTVINKILTVGFIYNTTTSKWGCVASAQET